MDPLLDTVPWRTAPPIKRWSFVQQNECFVDLEEDVHMVLASNGAVISSSITGHMKLKVTMAGMPELRLILNDAERRMIHRSPPATYITFSDVELHECVQRSRFAVDRTIAFVPPEGEFEVMTYRASVKQMQQPMLGIETVVNFPEPGIMEYKVKVTMNVDPKLTLRDLTVSVPTPPGVTDPGFKTTTGKLALVTDVWRVRWTIGTMSGGSSCSAVFRVTLAPDVTPASLGSGSAWRAPIAATFQITYHSASGAVVRSMRVIESAGYRSLTWVRYMTSAGAYHGLLPDW